MAAWQTPAQRRNLPRRRRRFMSTPRAIGLVLMLVGVSAYGRSPDWLALSVGLLGLAATLFADARYLRRAIARRHYRFLVDRAILLTVLAVVAAIWLWRLIDSRTLRLPP
jgi:UDP-N-acetylmuramyl pentapeptide phosphotransferase/UDP-N-acetylglucosamine-1-phosphate transferase